MINFMPLEFFPLSSLDNGLDLFQSSIVILDVLFENQVNFYLSFHWAW